MLEVVGIKASYKNKNIGKNAQKQVLKNVNFTAEEGQCIALVGANGTGKSTLLSILAGIQKAQDGRILYNGTDYLEKKNIRKLKRLSGYVPQDNPLMEELTVYDNLKLWYCHSKQLKEALLSGVLAQFDLDEYLHMPVGKLSGGMKKRVSIACALAEDPPIILMDEPTAALDMICKQEINEFIKNLKKKGKIIIFSTHNETELEICDKLYVLRNGELVEVSTGIRGKQLLNLQKREVGE